MKNMSLETLRTLRQSRQFTGEAVDEETIDHILEVARWTGSSRNTQPWQLIVVEDRDLLERVALVRELNGWAKDAAFAIAIVTPKAESIAERYDEGRLSERIMLAADLLGLGSGTAWFATPDLIAKAKDLLGVPEEMSLQSIVAIGHVVKSAKGSSGTGGRKQLSEIVSYNRFGERERE